MTMPTAFTVAMLAWGMLSFPDGYERAGQIPQGLDNIRWGTDYLLKTFRPDDTGAKKPGYLIVYQVCAPLFLPLFFRSLPPVLCCFAWPYYTCVF
jgi:hypothetical protein